MLAAITCRFNPAGFSRPLVNFDRFRGVIENQVDLFVIELAHHGNPFSVRGSYIGMRTESVLWHKENLLNILVNNLPPKYDTVAWVDSDIIMPGGWVEKVEKALEKDRLVQLFSSVEMLGHDDSVLSEFDSSSVVFEKSGRVHDPGIKGHPGLGWAAHREFFTEVGLFDKMIVGGGDEAAFYGAMGLIPWFAFDRIDYDFRGLAIDYVRRSFRYSNSRIGYIDQKIQHLWHGFQISRKYLLRQEILSEIDSTFLRYRNDGLMEWSDRATQPVKDYIANYFKSRQEDAHDNDHEPET